MIAREEFATRIARVRERMAEAGLDALACYGAHVDYAPGDLRYLADWFCIEEEQAMPVIPADGPVAVLTDSAADLDRAREQAVCDEVEADDRGQARRGGGAEPPAASDVALDDRFHAPARLAAYLWWFRGLWRGCGCEPSHRGVLGRANITRYWPSLRPCAARFSPMSDLLG